MHNRILVGARRIDDPVILEVPAVPDDRGIGSRDISRQGRFQRIGALLGRDRESATHLALRKGRRLVSAHIGLRDGIAVAVERPRATEKIVRDAGQIFAGIQAGRAGRQAVVSVGRIDEKRVGREVAGAGQRGIGAAGFQRAAGLISVVGVDQVIGAAVGVDDGVPGGARGHIEPFAAPDGCLVAGDRAIEQGAVDQRDPGAVVIGAVGRDQAVADHRAGSVDIEAAAVQGPEVAADDAALQNTAAHIPAAAAAGVAVQLRIVGDQTLLHQSACLVKPAAAVLRGVVRDDAGTHRAADNRHTAAVADNPAGPVRRVPEEHAVGQQTAADLYAAGESGAHVVAHHAVGDGAAQQAQGARTVAIGADGVMPAVGQGETRDERARMVDEHHAPVLVDRIIDIRRLQRRDIRPVDAADGQWLIDLQPDRVDVVNAVRDENRSRAAGSRDGRLDRLLGRGPAQAAGRVAAVGADVVDGREVRRGGDRLRRRENERRLIT